MLAPTLRRDLNSVGSSPYQQSTRVLDSWRQHPPDHEWQGNQAIPGPATIPRSRPMNKYRGTPLRFGATSTCSDDLLEPLGERFVDDDRVAVEFAQRHGRAHR